MSTEVNSPKFEDVQIYREEYIRELDKQVDKTEYAQANASSLYACLLYTSPSPRD